MSNKLRILAGSIVVESTISKEAKLQMLNFIQNEATDVQIKALLLDGEIVSLDEQAEEIVNARFKNSNINEDIVATAGDLMSTASGAMMASGAILATVVVAAITSQAYKVARLAFSKAHRICLQYKGNLKQQCINKVRKESLQKQLQSLSSGKSKCSKSKEPQKCRNLVDKKIASVKKKLTKLKEKEIN